MSGLLYVILTIAVLIVVGTIWGQISMRRLAAARAGENFDTFCRSFAWEVVPADVLRAVYAKFQERVSGFGVAEFPVRADDDIGRVYGMADEDQDEVLVAVIAACGRELPPRERLGAMPAVVTVRDFALFVAACPASPRGDAGR